MEEANTKRRILPQPLLEKKEAFWLFLLALLVFLLYASALFTPFYFADEGHRLTVDLRLSDYAAESWAFTLSQGRPFNALLFDLAREIEAGPGLAALRGLQLLLSIATALFCFLIIRRRSESALAAFLLVLLIWSQPALQIFPAYSMLLAYFLSLAASLAALLLVFRRPEPAALLAAFLLLSLAFWIRQIAPFFVLAILAFYAMRCGPDAWPRERRRVLRFLGLFLVCLFVYSAGYGLLIAFFGDENLYPRAKRMGSLLSSDGLGELLNHKNYLGPFEWWNYLLPLQDFRWARYQLTRLSALAFLALGVAAFLRERKQSGMPYARQKYLLCLLLLLSCFLPLLADGFSGRQHIMLAASPALILLSYAMARPFCQAFSGEKRRLLTIAAALLVAFVYLGGGASFYRGLVRPNHEYYNFIRQEILRQDSETVRNIQVLPADAVPCGEEPCSGFYRKKAGIPIRSKKFFRHVYERSTGKPAPSINIQGSGKTPAASEKTIVINLKDYMAAVKEREAGGSDQ